jgi:ribonucleoside-triphosphate reductase
MTGSIGVVTINLPRIAYISKSLAEFRSRLWKLIHIAKDSLEIKRKIIEDQTNKGLYPFSMHYLRNVKMRTGQYWYNHFSTIGIIGMNEVCLNLFRDGSDLTSKKGQIFAIETMEYLRELIEEIQQETGHFYNLEATPAEGTSYRLAQLDKTKYPEIICAGTDVPYYTNSTQLPVDFTDDIFETLDLQDKLQSLYTGGTVLHLYMGEQLPDIEVAKKLIKNIFTNYNLPYVSLTPTFSVCNSHGYINGEHFNCPQCGDDTEVWSRVVGYLRPVKNFHKGKREEYFERKKYVANDCEKGDKQLPHAA